MEPERPLIVIVGPTASGKSELALEVAMRFGGEIVCADSRTIYKGMDIGTAKASKKDQELVKHHIIDIVEPGGFFSAYDFQKAAKEAVADIRSRGKLPILAGGTGLYIDSIIFNYQFPKRAGHIRDKLRELTVEELQEYCRTNHITLPNNLHNRRHLIGAIERNNNTPIRRTKPLSNCIIVGITTNSDELSIRIRQRAEYIFSHGVVEEAKTLGKMYGWDNESMTANVYPIVYRLDKRQITQEAAVDESVILDRRLAKRQLTWLKRNPYISWYSLRDAKNYLFDLLAKSE